MTDPHTPAQSVAEIDAIIPGMATLADPGQINRAVLDALAARLPPDVLADRVHRLVFAKRMLMTKAGPVEQDDVRANEAGLKLAYAYQVGKPLERAAVVSKKITGDPDVDLATRLAKSPALRRSFKKIIMDAGD